MRFFEDCFVTFRAYDGIPNTLSIGSRLFVLGFFISIVCAIPSWIFCYSIVIMPFNLLPCTGPLIAKILGYIALGGGILAVVGFFMKTFGK